MFPGRDRAREAPWNRGFPAILARQEQGQGMAGSDGPWPMARACSPLLAPGIGMGLQPARMALGWQSRARVTGLGSVGEAHPGASGWLQRRHQTSQDSWRAPQSAPGVSRSWRMGSDALFYVPFAEHRSLDSIPLAEHCLLHRFTIL